MRKIKEEVPYIWITLIISLSMASIGLMFGVTQISRITEINKRIISLQREIHLNRDYIYNQERKLKAEYETMFKFIDMGRYEPEEKGYE